MAVNADKLVQIVPRVIDAGSSGLTFGGLFLSKSTYLPVGRVVRFASSSAVAEYFGSGSQEAQAAVKYFAGYVNTAYLPSYLYFARYTEEATSAWLRGAAYTGKLTDLKKISAGSLTITVDGVQLSTNTVNFSTETSFSACAEALATALNSGQSQDLCTVSYNSQTGAFQIQSLTTGEGSEVSFGSAGSTDSDLSQILNLTEQLGAVQSEASKGETLTDCMSNVLKYARDWVTFSTIFEPDTDHKIELAEWCASWDTRFLYVMWDSDNTAKLNGDKTNAGYQITTDLELDGTCPVYNSLELGASVMGAVACLNFNQYNGRTTLAYRQFEGVTVTCDDDEDYDALIANGYNCYADFATAANNFKFFQNGQVSGKFDWVDSYLNAIAIKDNLQLNILDLFSASRSLPYNDDGYSAIRTACLDTIDKFTNFGAIRTGITLSQTQKVTLLQEIGKDVSQTLETNGWYMSIEDPGSVVRGQRGTPNCYFYYMDGGSIQKIVMPATCIQ